MTLTAIGGIIGIALALESAISCAAHSDNSGDG